VVPPRASSFATRGLPFCGYGESGVSPPPASFMAARWAAAGTFPIGLGRRANDAPQSAFLSRVAAGVTA